MIRERIFRLHRHKSSSSSSSSSSSAGTDAYGHKFDFTFSNIQVLQVPKGWDKVSLSLISSESGKTVRKSGKVLVKNGTCKWTETFSESIWISENDSSKEMTEEYIFKFLVSAGSSRPSILGETSLNLTAFLSSESPVLVSLPLKKCNYGTILQVDVRCLTPKKNPRDEKWKEMHARKHESSDHDDMENRSEISDSTITKSIDSNCSSNNLGNSSRPRELGSSETSFSASVSLYSFDSMDDSVGRQSFSSQSDKNAGNNVIGRQDSIESNDSASYCSYCTRGSKKSVRSLQREEIRKLTYATKTFKETDDAPKVQELEVEARVWEQNARKLAANLENLRKEASTSRSECHRLTQEIEHLKLLQETESNKIHKDLEDEIKFQKEANENLSLLLKKTQESNIELISVFQDMEETIEKQKLEIEGLSANKIEFINICSTEHEFLNLQEPKRTLQGDIMVLESTLDDKFVETEIEQDLKNQILKECVDECNFKLAAKERKIEDLEAALSRALSDENLEKSEHNGHVDVSKEIGQLKEKIRELETDCNELTEENLELLFELKELRNVDHELKKSCEKAEIVKLQKQLASEKGSKNELLAALLEQLRFFLVRLEKEENDILLPLMNGSRGSIFDMDVLKSVDSSTQMARIKAVLDEIVLSQKNACECQNSSNDERNFNLRSVIEEIETQSNLKLQDDNSGISIGSYVSGHKITEPENEQTELVKHFSELQEENIYLSQRVSGLEAQLRYLTDTNELSRLELQRSESQVMVLRNQITGLEEQIESQKLAHKHKLSEMQKRWMEAQEECTALSKLNVKLQTTTESLVVECNSLQKFNGELREQKIELQKQCMFFEAEARKSLDFHCNCLENIGTCELKYSLLNGGFFAKEPASTFDELEENIIERAKREKLLNFFENITNDGSKRKSIIDELESKIKFSELEMLRLAEENSVLHVQLQKVPELQNEVLSLRVFLKETKLQTQLLEASFKSVLGDYEELKRENISMFGKISSMQKAASEAEDCNRKKNALEDKILRLEGDLIAKDALCVQDAEMKNEFNQMKIANCQYAMKVKSLEDEVKQTRHALDTNTARQMKLSKVSNEQDSQSIRYQVCARDYESRIQLLERELEKALEANDMYKSQHENCQSVASKISEPHETYETANTEHKISQLEAELLEIRERYLQISLKYAEVEAQREQLVMKLKALNS